MGKERSGRPQLVALGDANAHGGLTCPPDVMLCYCLYIMLIHNV